MFKKLGLKLLSLCLIISSIPTMPVKAAVKPTGEGSQQSGDGVVWGDYIDETRTAKIQLSDSNGNKITGTAQIVFPMEKVYDEMRVTVLHSANAYLAQDNDIYWIPELADFPVEPKKMFSNVLMGDSEENASPLGGQRQKFADVVDDYFDTEVKTTAVVGDAVRETEFVNEDGQATPDGEVDKIARFNTSKKVYSKNENSRTLQVLGYDILLAKEQCVMGEDDGEFYIDYAPTYAKSSLNSKALRTDTLVMDLYKAVGEYIWDIKCQYTDDRSVSVETTPLDLPTDHLTARTDFGGVSFKDAACWVWASRTNPELYWDTARKDRIFGGSQNVKTQHMYDGEAYAVTFNKNAAQTMTLGEFCAVARVLMELYGEPVMTEAEQKVMLQVYGFSLPDNLTQEQSNAVRYLAAKGIIDPTEVDFHKDVTFDDVSELLLRIADSSARLTFKEAQYFNTDSVLFNEGFVRGSLEDVADIEGMAEVADLDNDPYYDYFVESKDGFSNFTLLENSDYGTRGSVVSDALGLGLDATDDEYYNYSETGYNGDSLSRYIAIDTSQEESYDSEIASICHFMLDTYEPKTFYYQFINKGNLDKSASYIYDGKGAFAFDGSTIWENSYNYLKTKNTTKVTKVKDRADKREKWCTTNGVRLLVDSNADNCATFVNAGGFAFQLGGTSTPEGVLESYAGNYYCIPAGTSAETIGTYLTKVFGASNRGAGTSDEKLETEDVPNNDPLPIFVNKGITEDGFYHFRILKAYYNDTLSDQLDEYGSMIEDGSIDFAGAVEALQEMIIGDYDDGWTIDSDKITLGSDEIDRVDISEEDVNRQLVSENRIRIYLKKNKVGFVHLQNDTELAPTSFECADGAVVMQPQKKTYKNGLTKTIALKSNQVGIHDCTFKLKDKAGETRTITCQVEVTDKPLPVATFRNTKGKQTKYNALASIPEFEKVIQNPSKGTCILADSILGYKSDFTNYTIKIQTKAKKVGKKNKATYNTKKKAKFYIPNVSNYSVTATGWEDGEGGETYYASDSKLSGYNGIGVKHKMKKNNTLELDITCVDKQLTIEVDKTNGNHEVYHINVQHTLKNKKVDSLIEISYDPTMNGDTISSTREEDEEGEEEESETEVVATLDTNTSNPTYETDSIAQVNNYQIDAGGGVYLLEYGDPTISKNLNPEQLYLMRYNLDGQFLTAYEWDENEMSIANTNPAVDQTNVVMTVLFAKGWIKAWNSAAAILGEDNEEIQEEKTKIFNTLSRNGINLNGDADSLEEYATDFDSYNRLTFTLDSKYLDSSRVFLNTMYRGFLEKYNSISGQPIVDDTEALSYAALDAYTTGVIFQIPIKTWDSGNFSKYTYRGASMPLDELRSVGTIGARKNASYEKDGGKESLSFIIQDMSPTVVTIAVQGVSSLDVFKQHFKAPSSGKRNGVDNVYYDADGKGGSHDIMISTDTLHSQGLVESILKQKDGSIFIITKNGNNVLLYQKGTTGRVWCGDTVFLLPEDQRAYVESNGKTYINSRALLGWGTPTAALVESNGRLQLVIPSKQKIINKGKLKGVEVTSLYGASDRAMTLKGYNNHVALSMSDSYGLSNYLIVIDQTNNTGDKSRLLDSDQIDVKDYAFFVTPKMKIGDDEVSGSDPGAEDKLKSLGLSLDFSSADYSLHMIELSREERPTKETGQLGWVTQARTNLDSSDVTKAVFGYAFYPVTDNAAQGNVQKAIKATLTGDSRTAVPIVKYKNKYYNLLPNSFKNDDGLYPVDMVPGFFNGKETPQEDTSAQDADTTGDDGDDANANNNAQADAASVSANVCNMYRLKSLGGSWEKVDSAVKFDMTKGSILLAPTGIFFPLHGSQQMKVGRITSTDSKIYAGTMQATRKGTSIKIKNATLTSKADNLVVNLARAKTKTSGLYTLTPASITLNGNSLFTGSVLEVLSSAKVKPDWDKYKFNSLVENVDSLSSIFLILILNFIPRIGMLAFFILMLLTTLQGNRIMELFCEKVFDPVKVLTFNRQTFATLDLKWTLIQSMLALSLFFIVMDGHLLSLIEWSVKVFGALLNH